uniref:Uncharacterized protein n=1 Tax=Acrobeloides nanus TaxID=290746 RepID=A0A914CNK5_9BILA
MLTLDTLSEYVNNDKTYMLKELKGINNINIPGYKKSFLFNKMDFESKAQIFHGTRVIVEHYRTHRGAPPQYLTMSVPFNSAGLKSLVFVSIYSKNILEYICG